MTGRELITASLRLIGAVALGESLNASEATDGLAAMNRMIASWSNEALLIYSRVRETLVLTSSDGAYTMGASGNLNTTRPQKIDEAAISNDSVETSLKMVSLSEWQSIASKDVDGFPTALYVDYANPQANLNLWPRPDSAYTLVLWSWKPFTAIATLDTAVALPPGYDRALIFNGAVELASEYGKMVPDSVAVTASESKAALKRMNHRPNYLKVDTALLGGGGSNITTGGA